MRRARGTVIRVFMPCTGLGRELRGFEAFTRDCALALRARSDVAVTAFGGGPKLAVGERRVFSLGRRGRAARVLGGLLRRDPYFIEQASFFAAFLPAVIAGRPDVIYFGDLNLGNALWHWRRLTAARFRLLYYNGGATTRPFTRCDLVQQVSPEHLETAIARGESLAQQFLLPHGVFIDRVFAPPSPAERASRRAALGFDADATVVLSVGALDASVKRMDYVIDEVAAMSGNPHLVLMGAEGPETPAIRARAAARLPGRCAILTLPRAEARQVYPLADAFVLASRTEGFGIAQVEALAAGLPCVAHDTPTTAYVLGPHGVRADLTKPGALRAALADALDRARRDGPGGAAARHAYAYERFSWDRLAPAYAAALVACATGRRPDGVGAS